MVGIVIVTYNLDSRIFCLQIEAIRKFCKDEYTIEIVENSDDPAKARDLKYHIDRYGLNYRKTSASSINGTDSHTFAANTSYQQLKNKYDYLFYLDHDCIPVQPFSVKEILGDKIMAGLGQGSTIPYFWAGCVMWNNKNIDKSLIDLSPNHEFKLDTGGQLWRVIDIYGKDNCIFFDEKIVQNPNFTKGFYNFYTELNQGMFIHFINASNWNKSENHMERINSLINLVNTKING